MKVREFEGRMLRRAPLVGSLVVVVFLSLAWVFTRPEQSKTLENLQTAYNGEANAHARYIAFADQAMHEEHYEVASLFRAAAYAEQIHFDRFADVIRQMGGEPVSTIKPAAVKTTEENLRMAADEGEAYERDTLYPRFIREAEAEGNENAVRAFEYAQMTEAQHFKLFKAGLSNLKTTGVESHPYFVCKMCGYTAEHPVTPCPGCSDSHAVYAEVH